MNFHATYHPATTSTAGHGTSVENNAGEDEENLLVRA
jgi:hypothetical protein